MDHAELRRNATGGKQHWIREMNNIEHQPNPSATPKKLRTSERSFETQSLLLDAHQAQGELFAFRTDLSPIDRSYAAYESRIAQLENQLAQANKEKEASNSFLANLSHEIRNSVNSIVGMTSLLHDDTTEFEQKKHLSHLKEASDLLLALVTNVLDLSKMDQGQIKPKKESISFIPLLNSLAKTTAFRLWEKAIHFNYYLSPALPKQVISDKVLLYQILLNLLGNAIKFTEVGSISFSIEPISFEGNICWVKFSVSDTGVGFSESAKKRIFERFEQSGSESLKNQGAGLGLAISQNLVKLLGGTIQADSQLGKGSTFSVQLPFIVDKPESATPFFSKAPTLSFHHKNELQRILVVEDNPLNQCYLQSILDKWGYKVTLAENGQEALELMEKHSFDLAFIDLRIPILNGFETCIRLRNQGNNTNRSIPIIATSGSIEAEDKLKAQSVGMNDYLCKPFTPQELFNCLQKHQQQVPQQIDFKQFEFSTAFDHLRLEQLYMNNYKQVQLMFEIFLRNTPVCISQIDETWEKEDWTAFNDLVHKIKPTFSMVGLNHISTLAKQLEEDFNHKPSKSFIQETFNTFRKAVMNSLNMVSLEKEKLESFQLINP